MKRVSTTWFSHGFNSHISCPVEGCTHVGQVITKAHLRIAHDMTREEVAKKYGYPEVIQSRGTINSDATSRKWNSVSQTTDL